MSLVLVDHQKMHHLLKRIEFGTFTYAPFSQVHKAARASKPGPISKTFAKPFDAHIDLQVSFKFDPNNPAKPHTIKDTVKARNKIK